MQKCPYCSKENPDEAIVCRYCGANLILPTLGSAAKQGAILSVVVSGIYALYAVYKFPNVLAIPGKLILGFVVAFLFWWVVCSGGVLVWRKLDWGLRFILGLALAVVAFQWFIAVESFLGGKP